MLVCGWYDSGNDIYDHYNLIHGNQYFIMAFVMLSHFVLGGGIFGNIYWFCFLSALLFQVQKNRNHSNSKCYYFSGNFVGISVLINIFLGNKDVSDTTYYISLIMILSITCVAFIGSYFLSALYFRKEIFIIFNIGILKSRYRLFSGFLL